MIDIETFGVDPGCVITSIAAVPFNLPLEGRLERLEGFRVNVDIQSCMTEGLVINGDTLTWWMNQKPGLMRAMAQGSVPLRHALKRLAGYCESSKSVFVWSHGATFDIPILDWAYKQVGFNVPWSYRGVRDTRTIYWSAHTLYQWEPKRLGKAPPDKHDPLADAHRQVSMVQEVWMVLLKGGKIDE